MNEILNRVADALFPSTGDRVRNVKFFRGCSSTVTAEELSAQLESANEQVANGKATLVESVDRYKAVAS